MDDSRSDEGARPAERGASEPAIAELAAALKALYESTDETLRTRFKRSLPFQDGFFDRWARARRLGFGDGASIYNSALVYGDVHVGRESWVGPNVLLDGSAAPLRIGDYVSVASGVHIYTHDTVQWSLSGGVAGKRTGTVEIGDCVYIGPQSIIALGTVVGRQCVIAANSFVKGTVEPGAVVAGSPARRIGRVIGQGHDVAIRFD